MELFAILLVLFGIWLYFLPAIIASQRNRAPGPIFILNLLLGWTLAGWVVALVWANTERSAKEEIEFSKVKPGPSALGALGASNTTSQTPPAVQIDVMPVKIADNLGWWYVINYAGSDGTATPRKVRIDKLFTAPKSSSITNFVAHDSLTNENRTFHTDRVIGYAPLTNEEDDGPLNSVPIFAETLAARIKTTTTMKHPDFAPEA